MQLTTHAAEVVQFRHTLDLVLLPRGPPRPLLVAVGSGSGVVSSGGANSARTSAFIITAAGASAGCSAYRGAGTSKADLAYPIAAGVEVRTSRG